MENEVFLRNVTEADLPVFHRQQAEPEANRMAAFPSRDWQAFFEHWAKILADDTLIKQTVVFDGQVAGNIVCFEQEGKLEVGYWLGKEFWGKGIATRALAQLLRVVTTRPLYGYVARHNTGSARVLEKCGFKRIGEDVYTPAGGEPVEELIYRLDGDEPPVIGT